MIRVEVLGPLVVRRDGAEVPLGPPQQRALCTALVPARGVPLRATTPAAEIWEDEHPASAVAVVRKYVHHLRRLLGDELTLAQAGLGRHEAAEWSFTRSAEIHLGLGAHSFAAAALRSPGDVHRDAGRHDRADAAYPRAPAAEHTVAPGAAALREEPDVHRT
ncbi:hypothetical protein [Streptomyces fagopyri]|uniref:AfsR/SARP family transcriptional regulator n=1 Tax=Streptomyces fagopyri TaxID=2662397 RepID=UPI003714A7ED